MTGLVAGWLDNSRFSRINVRIESDPMGAVAAVVLMNACSRSFF